MEQIDNGLFVTDYQELVDNSWKILLGETKEWTPTHKQLNK